jgi:hypothetical protein
MSAYRRPPLWRKPVAPMRKRLPWSALVAVATFIVVTVATGRPLLGFASGCLGNLLGSTAYDVYWRRRHPPEDD